MKRKLAFFFTCLLIVTIGIGGWITEESKHTVTNYYQYNPSIGQWVYIEPTARAVIIWQINPGAHPDIKKVSYEATDSTGLFAGLITLGIGTGVGVPLIIRNERRKNDHQRPWQVGKP